MSMYVDFFIKRDNKFIRIADYSRNSQIYEITSHYLPYEKVRALTIHDLEKFSSIARENIEECKKRIGKINIRISNIFKLFCTSTIEIDIYKCNSVAR